MATAQAQHRLFERVRKNETTMRPQGAPKASGASPTDSVTERGIVIGDWTITVLHGSIGNASEIDALTDLLGIPPPEMLFPRNALILHHKPSGFEYCFDATRALQCVEGVRSENALSPIECVIGINSLDAGSRRKTHRRSSGANIKVSYADEWGKSRCVYERRKGKLISRNLSSLLEHGKPAPDAGDNVATNNISSTKQFDWTYSSTWPGAAGTGASAQDTSPDDGFCAGSDPARDRIPTERLGPGGEPILFYDEVMLYEDELGDNGSSMLNVKVRVMPSSFLVLQRFFLRVDNVVFRVFDTRLYCSFQSADGEALMEEERRAWSANDAQAGRPAPASWPRVIRECRGIEVPYDEVKRRLPPHKPDDLSQLTNVNWVAETMRAFQMNKLRQQLGAGGPAAMAPTPAAAPGGPSSEILGELPVEDPRNSWEGDGQCVDVATLRYGVGT